ncbi:MAG: hypothetical protein DMG08_16975, partial [Acidobacteria bacterium]
TRSRIQYVALLRGINVGGKNLMPGMRGMLLLCIKQITMKL